MLGMHLQQDWSVKIFQADMPRVACMRMEGACIYSLGVMLTQHRQTFATQSLLVYGENPHCWLLDAVCRKWSERVSAAAH